MEKKERQKIIEIQTRQLRQLISGKRPGWLPRRFSYYQRSAQIKYADMVGFDLAGCFPVYVKRKPLSRRQILKLFQGACNSLNRLENVEGYYQKLKSVSARSSFDSDLLNLERAIGHAGLASPCRCSARRIESLKNRALRYFKSSDEEALELERVIFILIHHKELLSYPNCGKPASKLASPLLAAVFRHHRRPHAEILAWPLDDEA